VDRTEALFAVLVVADFVGAAAYFLTVLLT
jgi:hypothetical protein